MARRNSLGESEVVSIRIPVETLELTKVAAALLDTTPNAIVRKALEIKLADFKENLDPEEATRTLYGQANDMLRILGVEPPVEI